MAIPTQFSVAKTRKCPLANPSQHVDGASPLTAEDVGFISGASVLPAKSAGGIGAPSELSALPINDVDNASLFSALSAVTINDPSIIAAEYVVPVDNASDLTARPKAEVDAPNFTIVDRTQWNFPNSLSGWTANNATLTPGPDAITAVMTGTDFQFIKGDFTEGSGNPNILWFRIRCTTATVTTTVQAFTLNSKHGYTSEFMVQGVPTEIPQGVYVDFYLNLGEIQDYLVDGMTSLRIDPYDGSPQTFEIDFVILGRYKTDISARDESSIKEPSALSAKSSAAISNPVALSAEDKSSVALPSAASAESAPSISAPSALTANQATQTSGPFPLNHARILYNNKLFGYESVTSIKGVPLNALTPNTWQRWIFDSSTTSSGIRVDLPSAVTMDCICIGAHNLGAIGATVSITYSTDGSTFVDWAPDFDVGGRAAIMSYTQTPKQVKSIQIFIQAGTTATGYIGYISAGEALQMQRPFFSGHQPYTDADVTEYYSNRTESGNIIGRQIRRRGFETTYEWQNIDDTWYRNNIPVFKDYAKRWPMFIAWNLLEYPYDVAFGETTGDIKASMQNGTRTKRTGLSFTLKGV